MRINGTGGWLDISKCLSGLYHLGYKIVYIIKPVFDFHDSSKYDCRLIGFLMPLFILMDLRQADINGFNFSCESAKPLAMIPC